MIDLEALKRIFYDHPSVLEVVAEIERLQRFERISKMVCPDCFGIGERTVSSGQTPESYQEETVECQCITNIKEEAHSNGYREGAVVMREAAAKAVDREATILLRRMGAARFAGSVLKDNADAIRALSLPTSPDTAKE